MTEYLSKKKLLLSVDTGIDDALAIAYAAGQREAELIGITASFGMSTLPNTFRNTLRFSRLVGLDVPVLMGSSEPLSRPGRDYRVFSSPIHGSDGLAGIYGECAPGDIEGAEPGAAVDFIIDAVHTYGQDLILVTTGPLTDLAKVIRRDPSVIDSIGAIYSMVGVLASPGNINPYTEANAGLDPEAVKEVLEADPPLTVIGLDVTRKTIFTREDLRRWQSFGTVRSEVLSACADYYLRAYLEMHPYLAGSALHDPLAVGAALHPEWISAIPMCLTCVTEGVADGRTLEDIHRPQDKIPRTKGAFAVDSTAFIRDFFEKTEKILREC